MSTGKEEPLVKIVLKNGFEVTGNTLSFPANPAWPFVVVKGSVMRIEVAINEIQHVEYINPSNVRSLK